MSLFPGRKREGMYKILLHNKAAKELRVGEYRIVYRVEEEEEVVILEDIKLRGMVY